jgi:PPOX class probable F420-dependent enzyme
MPRMTHEEYLRFMREGTRTAKLATVRADGRPHVAPVWFVMDGEEIVFNTGADTVKGRNLLRDGRVALSVDSEEPPFSFVVVEGTATAEDGAEDLLPWATRIGGRYMGEERAEEFGCRNGVPGELLVRVTPTKIVAHKDVAD